MHVPKHIFTPDIFSWHKRTQPIRDVCCGVTFSFCKKHELHKTNNPRQQRKSTQQKPNSGIEPEGRTRSLSYHCMSWIENKRRNIFPTNIFLYFSFHLILLETCCQTTWANWQATKENAPQGSCMLLPRATSGTLRLLEAFYDCASFPWALQPTREKCCTVSRSHFLQSKNKIVHAGKCARSWSVSPFTRYRRLLSASVVFLIPSCRSTRKCSQCGHAGRRQQ